MLGNLLIRNKHGRGVITYGVNHNNFYNMKIAFICAVILISCNSCVYGELDFLTGYKPRDQYLRSDPSQEDVSFSSFYQNYLSPHIDERELFKKFPQRFKDLDELMNQRRKNFKAKAQAQSYMRYMLNDPGDYDLRRLSIDRLNLAPASQQMLDDIRPYPREESDFTFRDDDEGNIDSDIDQEADFQDQQVFLGNDEDEYEPRIKPILFPKQTESIIEAQLDDDPTYFAYKPPDPRYYENDNDIPKATTPPSLIKDDDTKQTTPSLTRRSEEDNSKPGIAHEDIIDELPKSDMTYDGVTVKKQHTEEDSTGVYIIAMIAGVSAAATVGLIAFGIGWINLQKHAKNASDVDYPAYGVTGPNKEVSPSGDRRLAQSAQMYHYQHQKQQIIAMESRAAAHERHGSLSEADSDEENEEGDYTVYECPGLAPTGEMEVKNPLFQDDPTPAQTPAVKSSENNAEEKK